MEIVECIDSTNSELLRRIAAGDTGPHRLLAKSQSGGRGRSGRTWQSPSGNVYFSQTLQLDVPIAELPALTLALGVAAAKVLGLICAEVSLKWPNDLIARGAKLGGILVELATAGEQVFVVAGIGVNVNLAPDAMIDQAVIDLLTLAPKAAPDSVQIAENMADAWQQASVQFAKARLQSFLADFAKLDWLAGKKLQLDAVTQLRLGTGWSGAGISSDGRYRIERDGQFELLHSGEVKLQAGH